jgi:formamidopyrimidine-DNA glycosylase
MPELPEVQTTVNGINAEIKGLRIVNVWTSYNSLSHREKNDIKNPKYFLFFKKHVVGNKIIKAERRGKNVLIHLSNNFTILTHMKMTGHFMYGKYEPGKIASKKSTNKKTVIEWSPIEKGSPLSDPFNKNIRLLFTFSNGKHLAFADTRKFAKIFIFETKNRHKIPDLVNLGPDPLSKDFSVTIMKERLMIRRKWKIKQTLLDQEIISGIGNIYSDEILWSSNIHPLSIVSKIPAEKIKKLYKVMKDTLKKGLDFGGDSASDYRNIYGLPGKFQHKHNVYRRANKPCPKNDGGVIEKIKIGGRSTHFCPIHQIIYK